MKISRMGLGVVSILVVFTSAAAVFGNWYADRSYSRKVVRVSAAAAPVRLNGAQPQIPRPLLRLSGEVIELAAGAPLTVTATVGANTFPATVTGNTYTVLIGRPAPQQMVTVEARSTRVHYRTVVGSADRVRTLAGSDLHLTLSEQPSLRVSPYSTALGWLVRYALGDRDAASDAEFEKMPRVAASSDLEYAAYVLAAFAKGELYIPDGFTGYADGYQLLRDRDAFREFIAYGARELSAGYLFQQPQEQALASSETMPGQLAFVNGMPREQLPIYAGEVFLLGRRSDGRFDLNERLPMLDPIHALALDGQGRIQLTPIGTQVRVIQKPDQNNQYRWFDRTAVGRTLKRLTRGDATSVWVMRSVWNDREQGNPSSPGTQEIDYQTLSSTELSVWSVPDGWASVAASTRTLPWMCAESAALEETVFDLSDCGYVEHRFETNGSGRTMDHGWKVNAQTMSPAPARSEQFTWLRGAQGALDLTDGKVATSFWRLKDYPAGIGPVFFRTKALTGEWVGKTMVGINMTALKSMTSWPQAAVAGDWQAGVDDFLPNWYTTNNFSNLVQRMTGGAGQEIYASNGPLPFSWQAVSNAVYDKRIRAFGSTPPYVDSCETAEANGADSCYTRVRYFKPITRVGNRHYGIQDVYERFFYPETPEAPEESANSRRSSALVYYDCAGGACASAAAIAAPQGVRVGTATGARLRGTTPVLMQPQGRKIPNGRQ